MASLTIQLTDLLWWSVLGLPEQAHFGTKTLRQPYLMRRVYQKSRIKQLPLDKQGSEAYLNKTLGASP